MSYFDMTPVMTQIEAGKNDKARPAIANMYMADGSDLYDRVDNMTKALTNASDIMVEAM